MAEMTSKPGRRRATVKPPFAAPPVETTAPAMTSIAVDHLPMIDPISHPAAAEPAETEPKDAPMATTFEETAQTAQTATQTQAHAAATDFAARTQGAMDKGKEMVAEMTSFAKGNVEALVESTSIYARGIESLGQEAASFAKKSYEEATAAMKAMTAAKSPTELMKLHSDYTRQMFDAFVSQTSQSTEKMVKLVGESVQPISTRVSLAADKAKLAA